MERKAIGSFAYFPAKAGKYKDSLTAEDVKRNIFAVRLFYLIVYAIVCECFKHFKLSLRQRLLKSPLKRGAGGVLRQTYTPLYPLFLEGNHTTLKFLNVKLHGF
jgi:hypothetical protein